MMTKIFILLNDEEGIPYWWREKWKEGSDEGGGGGEWWYCVDTWQYNIQPDDGRKSDEGIPAYPLSLPFWQHAPLWQLPMKKKKIWRRRRKENELIWLQHQYLPTLIENIPEEENVFCIGLISDNVMMMIWRRRRSILVYVFNYYYWKWPYLSPAIIVMLFNQWRKVFWKYSCQKAPNYTLIYRNIQLLVLLMVGRTDIQMISF